MVDLKERHPPRSLVRKGDGSPSRWSVVFVIAVSLLLALAIVGIGLQVALTESLLHEVENAAPPPTGEARRAIEAAVAFVKKRGDDSLDVTSACILWESESHFAVAFDKREPPSSECHVWREGFRVEKSTLAVTPVQGD